MLKRIMNPRHKNKIALAILLAAVAASAIILFQDSFKEFLSRKLSPAAQTQNAAAPGFARFTLPHGSQTYQIAQAKNAWPKILQATIDPPDVHVGDRQKLKIMVQSPEPIVSVVARTQLDASVATIVLSPEGPASAAELLPVSYEVGPAGEVLALKSPKTLLEPGGSFSASAAEPPIYSYAGEWIVRDTHNTFYRTTFTVRDASGRENSVTLAWSDACGIPASGNWTMAANCTISSADGVDGGNATISAGTLTLNAAFYFNQGYSVTISGSGSIAIGSLGQLKKAYICMVDADGDGYVGMSIYPGANSNCSDLGGSYQRRSALSSTSTSATNFSGSNITGVGTVAWTIRASNGEYLSAQAALTPTATTSNWLYLSSSSLTWPPSGGGIGIPVGATITGIKLGIQEENVPNQLGCSGTTTSTAADNAIQLVLPSGATSTSKATSTPWSTSTLAYVTYGGSGDLWGFSSLAQSDVNTSTFQMRISVNNTSAGNWACATVASTTLTVYYIGYDCNDANANVHPNQAAYFTTATTTNVNLTTGLYDGGGEVNFDYNCDGVETKNVTSYNDTCSEGGCVVCGPTLADCSAPCCSLSSSGNNTPACGVSYTPLTGCSAGGTKCSTPCQAIYSGCVSSNGTATTTACR